jgi:hypothetical protein
MVPCHDEWEHFFFNYFKDFELLVFQCGFNCLWSLIIIVSIFESSFLF